MGKKDNTTYKEKVSLRRFMLRRMDEGPVILEAYGGLGHLWAACYPSVLEGVVFEKKPDRAARLAKQRPTWAVYRADCVTALAANVGAHLEVNVLDLDPYGEPWPVITAFFESERPRAKKLFVVVNDGLLLKIKLGGAWSVKSLQAMVQKYGNRGLLNDYLGVCRELMEIEAAKAAYTLAAWAGYHCGHGKQMTHYLAYLERRE